jgi:hypothetical protein
VISPILIRDDTSRRVEMTPDRYQYHMSVTPWDVKLDYEGQSFELVVD